MYALWRGLSNRPTRGNLTKWPRITCFNGLCKTVAEHCDKRIKVFVNGRIHYTKWADPAGVVRYCCEIVAEKVDYRSRPKSAEFGSSGLVDRDDETPFGVSLMRKPLSGSTSDQF